jgi:hypothetical protein
MAVVGVDSPQGGRPAAIFYLCFGPGTAKEGMKKSDDVCNDKHFSLSFLTIYF